MKVRSNRRCSAFESLESRQFFAAVLPAFADKIGIATSVNPTPTFDDEFDGNALDSSKWQTREWSRWRAQSSSPDLAWTTKDSVVVGNGELQLVAHNNPVTGRYESGWIQTSSSGPTGSDPTLVPGASAAFTQQYGYWEAKLKFSSMSGEWNAFWVHSYNMPQVGEDISRVNQPQIYGTEMDVVEQSSEVYGQPSPNTVHTTTHANGYGSYHISSTSHTDLTALGGGGADQYHIYGLLWSDTAVKVYIDGNLIYTETDPNKVSKVAQMAILSNEIGSPSSSATSLGHDTWGTVPPGGFGSVQTSQAKLTADYVRVWQLNAYAPPAPTPPATPPWVGNPTGPIIAPVTTRPPRINPGTIFFTPTDDGGLITRRDTRPVAYI